MHDLVSPELPAKVLLHHEPVFQHELPVDLDPDVSLSMREVAPHAVRLRHRPQLAPGAGVEPASLILVQGQAAPTDRATPDRNVPGLSTHGCCIPFPPSSVSR